MKLRTLILAFTLLPLAAHAEDLRHDALAASLAPIDAASAIKAVKGNDVTPAKIELGQKLFFDPRLFNVADQLRLVPQSVARRWSA